MSVIKTRKTIVCDICGEKIRPNFGELIVTRHRFYMFIDKMRVTHDMCDDCYEKIKSAIRNGGKE